jgi:hypothetical protein
MQPYGFSRRVADRVSMVDGTTVAALIVLAALTLAARPARAMDLMYPPAEIQRDTPRLKRRVEQNYKLVIEPVLTPTERSKIGNIELRFPPPRPDSSLLNFYAYRNDGRSVIVMPVLSLKQLEDLMTAYSWLQVHGKSHSTIDLYFAMLRRRAKHDFPGQRYPDILSALGVPKTANNDKRVDFTSLSLRNEAYSFVLAHELGHIVYRHKPYHAITPAQARADEREADKFALDILLRSNTAPMGAVFFFQAQAYAMPHRGEYATEKEWRRYLRRSSTHPLSTERITQLANAIRSGFAARRPGERAHWTFIAAVTLQINTILEDVDIQRCIAKVSRAIPLAALKPTIKATGIETCLQPAATRN